MTPSDTVARFIEVCNTLYSDGSFIKLTLSKPRQKNSELKNIYIRPVMLRNTLQFSCTYHYLRRDEVKNYSPEELIQIKLPVWLNEHFFNAHLAGREAEYELLQSKSGNARINHKKSQIIAAPILTHNKEKNRLIPTNRSYLHMLGITDNNGRVYDKAQDKYRQIQKYIEIADSLIRNISRKNLTIADMGSGKGYLSFALYDWLCNSGYEVEMLGIELRQDLVAKCNEVAIASDFRGLKFTEGDISSAEIGRKDIVIALHACDIATDMAIAKGIAAGAEIIIVAPCCHKQVRKSMQGNPLLSPILQHGILAERQAEILTDGIRALYMEHAGYRTKVFEFISSEHTAKNIMITGIKSTRDLSAKSKAEAIKSFFGISYHYLEKLLAMDADPEQ
ncbi:MAG: SAM-dependent methyltransferase [Saprospiraceae bacterium]|nr:SAM-dependent methyltransferase [Saprospiraceae bacterium]